MVTSWPARPHMHIEKGVCVGSCGARLLQKNKHQKPPIPGQLKVVLMSYLVRCVGTGPDPWKGLANWGQNPLCSELFGVIMSMILS